MATKYRIEVNYSDTRVFYNVAVAKKCLWMTSWSYCSGFYDTLEEAKANIDKRVADDKLFPMEYP